MSGATPDEASIRRWCKAYLAKVTRVPAERIGDAAEFPSLGMDSAELLFMVSALEDEYGVDLDSDTTTRFITTESLAGFIAGEVAAKRGRR